MTTENDFLWFANGGSANVLDQTDYAALAAIINGFPSGILPSEYLNKALRQASAGSALLGLFMAAYGQAAVDNGNLSTLLTNFEAALLAAVRPGFSATQEFTSSGTWTVPANITQAKVRVWGGGGASGGVGSAGNGSAGGGGGGGYSEKIVTGLTSGTVIAVTVGSGGAAAGVGSTGGTGGTSSFGSYLSATGGGGGLANPSGNGGSAGTASGGSLNSAGAGGGSGAPGSGVIGGNGGGSPFGGSGGSGAYGTSVPGCFPGGGGGAPGAAGSNTNAIGANGLVIVEW